MEQLSEKAEHGLAVVGDMLGAEFAEQMRALAQDDQFSSAMTRMSLEFAFADGWGRPGLDRKSKSIAILSTVIALRAAEPVKYHTKIGLAHGMTLKDFESLLTLLIPYVGFPAVAQAQPLIIEALRESGQDPGDRLSPEKAGHK